MAKASSRFIDRVQDHLRLAHLHLARALVDLAKAQAAASQCWNGKLEDRKEAKAAMEAMEENIKSGLVYGRNARSRVQAIIEAKS
jgi:hypothetical protein